MLFFLLCGLFPHTHGYHYRQPFQTYPSSLSPYGSIHHDSHTFQAYPENHGTHTSHTFEKSQPQTSYSTYTYENSQSYGNGHVQQYPWQNQWKSGWIANRDDGRQGGGQGGESHVGNGQNLPSQHYPWQNQWKNDWLANGNDRSQRGGQDGESHVGNGQDLPSQEKEGTFFLFGSTTKPNQGSNDNFHATETKPSTDEINEDDDSKTPSVPGEANHDDHEPDALPFSAKSSHNDNFQPPLFPGKISDDDDSKPPTFPGHISDGGNPAPPPFPGKIRDDDDTDESPPFPGTISDDDSEPPLFPGKISDDDSQPPPFPGNISNDDDSKPPPFPGNVSDDDDSEPPLFPGKISDGDDSEPLPFPGKISDDGNRAPPLFSGKIIDDDDTEPPPFPSKNSDNDDTEPPPFPGNVSDDDDTETPLFSGKISDGDDSEPPPFPDKISDDGNSASSTFTGKIRDDDEYEPPTFPEKVSDDDDSEPPPFPGKIRDDDEYEPPIFPEKNSDDDIDDDSEPQPFPGKTSDNGNSASSTFPGKIRDDDEYEPPTFPGKMSDDDSELPPFPGKMSDDDDSEPPPFPCKISDDDDSEPPQFPGKISEGDASYSGSSGVSEDPTIPGDTSDSMKYSEKISPYTNPVRIGEVSKDADEMNEDKTDQSSIGNSDSPMIREVLKTADHINVGKTDQSSIGNSEFRLLEMKNTTTPKPPPSTTRRPSGQEGQSGPQPEPYPGTRSRPVPKLGLLFAPSLQWHVGIYSKSFTPYMQVCGGSLVKSDVVLSAAHCFWNDDVGAVRPGLFAVAAGKLLRPWEIEGEIYTQHSDIKDIKIPPRFRGGKTSFQDDIAVVLLTMALEYAPGVKPVCVSFDPELERRQLTSGNLGTIAGWGLTEPNGPPSQRLNYLKLPYVDIEECIRTAEDSFLKYITSDKICAGDQKTGRALCHGDSGGGLIYYSSTVPYLHGIASTAPRDSNQCNAYAVAGFTHVLAHRRFLEAHVPGIEEGCEELYVNTTASAQYDITGVPQEIATESNISTQVQTEKIFTNPILVEKEIFSTNPLENISNASEPLTLTAPNEDLTDRMWQNEGFTNVTELTNLSSQNAEQLTDTPILESEANESKGYESIKTNEEPIKTNQESIKTNEESIKTNEELIKTDESIKTDEESIKTNESRKTPVETRKTDEESIKTNEESGETNEESTVLNVESNEEIVMNVGSGERGVARVLVDNSTKTFVCNCYCRK